MKLDEIHLIVRILLIGHLMGDFGPDGGPLG